MRIVWTEFARICMREIFEYIEQDNPRAASRVTGKIRIAVRMLATYPQSGRPGRISSSRELVIAGTPYIVPYRVRGNTVELLAVLHGAQKWPKTLDAPATRKPE